ncbi:hypothetical protein SAMN05192566_1025 [Methylophilus rhizosphaerae]|uniref:Uncharacterized protein n=1 Tax=Methylophilus rhizosphaerae TaxID=492660 RepID=A0A1G9B7B0_9PROT|nr:hypothetical protein SAMN05192566_1025 [Methylophilus rhizosphaerae]
MLNVVAEVNVQVIHENFLSSEIGSRNAAIYPLNHLLLKLGEHITHGLFVDTFADNYNPANWLVLIPAFQ